VNEKGLKFVINAKVTGTNIVKNAFFGAYTEYVISITTNLTMWQVRKRFRDFEKLNKELSGKVVSLPTLPEKSIFNMNEKVVSERKVKLEEYLNQLLSTYNLMAFPEIMNFIEMTRELFTLLTKSPSEIETKRDKSRSMVKTRSYELIKANSTENKIHSSFYKDFYRNDSDDDEQIDKFLRKLEEAEDNTSETVDTFWKKLTKKWPVLGREDVMKLFFGNGNDLKGLLEHCGRIKENYFGAESCLWLLNKFLQFEFNPDCEKFVGVMKMARIENIRKMRLQEHLRSKKGKRYSKFFEYFKRNFE